MGPFEGLSQQVARDWLDFLRVQDPNQQGSFFDVRLQQQQGGQGTPWLDFVIAGDHPPYRSEVAPHPPWPDKSFVMPAQAAAKVGLAGMNQKAKTVGQPATPGATVSLDDIKTVALQMGLGEEGARVAMAIAQTEGGLTGNVGDQSIGGSYGIYQFYTKGMLPAYAASLGLDVPTAGEYARQHPLEAATWALSGYLGKAIKDGMAQGLRGPALATYAQRVGQRSKNPERAGTVYASMFK